MTAIPFPLSTSPGQNGQEGAGRLINCFAEPRGENFGPVWRRAPGATIFGEDAEASSWTYWTPAEWFLGAAEVAGATYNGIYRGGILVGGTLYVIMGERAYTVDFDGTATQIGVVPGDDLVFLARNNAQPTPDIVLVCDAGPFLLTSTAVSAYPDSNVGSPNSVCFHDGYFIFGYGTGRLQASDINGTDVNTLNFATAESNPDGIIRPVSYRGQLYACGSVTIEIFGVPINTTGFPFNRIGYHTTPGLLGPFCIAGFEPEFGHPPIYVGSDYTVRMLVGDASEKISPPDLDRLIEQENADGDAGEDINCLCYVAGGHAFWQINLTTASWVFDLNTLKWHERQSWNQTTSRLRGSVFSFDGQWFAGDTDEAQILIVNGAQDEAGDPLVFHAESGPVADFPERSRVTRSDFNFSMGVGEATGDDPIETDPTVRVSYSNDGINWSTPLNRKLGRQNVTNKRVILPPTGMTGTQGRRWRVQVSDPVHVGLLGASMDGVPADK